MRGLSAVWNGPSTVITAPIAARSERSAMARCSRGEDVKSGIGLGGEIRWRNSATTGGTRASVRADWAPFAVCPLGGAVSPLRPMLLQRGAAPVTNTKVSRGLWGLAAFLSVGVALFSYRYLGPPN